MKFKSRHLVNFSPDPESHDIFSYAVASDMYSQIFDTKFTWAIPYYIRAGRYKKLRKINKGGSKIPDNLLLSIIFGACITKHYGAIVIFPTKTYLEAIKDKTGKKKYGGENDYIDILIYQFKSPKMFTQNIQDFKDFTLDFLKNCIRKEDTTAWEKIKKIMEEKN